MSITARKLAFLYRDLFYDCVGLKNQKTKLHLRFVQSKPKKNVYPVSGLWTEEYFIYQPIKFAVSPNGLCL